MDTVQIFDTTLRDGEQSPGDLEAPRAVASEIKHCRVAALARAKQDDVEAALRGLEPAAKPRLHIFLATSDLHLKHKLRTTREQALEQIASMIRFGRQNCEEVEFSAEDASRSDMDYLCQVVLAAVESGAMIINLPDTVGYSTPDDYAAMFRKVRSSLGAHPNVVLSAHCHDDLGMALANSLAAIDAGVRQIECTINGIGERAGNASLEELAVALHVRQDRFAVTTNLKLEMLYPTSRMLSKITNVTVPPNKAVVGANAFAHEAGIHQDGILKNPLTYEIIVPELVGVPARRLVLGKHSGRNAYRARLAELGYETTDAELAECYRLATLQADAEKEITDRDLINIIHKVRRQPAAANAR